MENIDENIEIEHVEINNYNVNAKTSKKYNNSSAGSYEEALRIRMKFNGCGDSVNTVIKAIKEIDNN